MKTFLIVGAGPVGLAAAYFFSTLQNTKITIIEKMAKRPTFQPGKYIFSKALHFNIRSLQLFQNTSVQKRIIEAAMKGIQLNMYSQGKPIINLKVKDVLSRISPYDNLFFIPQNVSEHILEEEVNKKGIKVNYGQQLVKVISNNQQGVQVQIKNLQNNKNFKQKFNYVLASDGSKSTTRKQLGLKMEGQTSKNSLFLGDYQVQENQDKKVDFIRSGTSILMIMPVTSNVVRIMGNTEKYLDLLPKEYKYKKCLYTTNYQINNRVIQKLQLGNVFFIGDAAHVHAPIGGRGMNMGIEDAFVLCQLFKTNKQQFYNESRKKIIDDFVNQVRRSQKFLLSTQNHWEKKLIFWFLPYLFPFVRQKAVIFLSGIDHQIPQLKPSPKL